MTEEEEHKRTCLARWLLDHWHTRQERRASLERMHGHVAAARGKDAADRFVADLEERVQAEWDRRKGKAA